MTDQLREQAAAIWQAAKAAVESGAPSRCYTHQTTGYCTPCEAAIDLAADTYDPETGRCQRPRKARP